MLRIPLQIPVKPVLKTSLERTEQHETIFLIKDKFKTMERGDLNRSIDTANYTVKIIPSFFKKRKTLVKGAM